MKKKIYKEKKSKKKKTKIVNPTISGYMEQVRTGVRMGI